jgi:uncharacterized protein DUF5825
MTAELTMGRYPEFASLTSWHITDGMLVLEKPLGFGADSVATAWAVALLRECQSFGLTVRWRAVQHAGFEFSMLRHLFPPRSLDSAQPDAELAAWRDDYKYGRCFFRMGPGFVQVKDVRSPSDAARLLLAEPGVRDMFLRCLRPTLLATLPARERAAVSELAAEGLVLRSGGLAVTVVPRMRRWPVPAGAV